MVWYAYSLQENPALAGLVFSVPKKEAPEILIQNITMQLCYGGDGRRGGAFQIYVAS